MSLEYLADGEGNPVNVPAMQFDFENHDNLFAIIERLEKREDFSPEMARQFGVGLKLFSEVMIENRSNPLFSDLLPQFGAFMQKLKKG